MPATISALDSANGSAGGWVGIPAGFHAANWSVWQVHDWGANWTKNLAGSNRYEDIVTSSNLENKSC
tara:strand:+ start:237 stop:437 length:201 start_codon:yes stop_codon:yes gene_type:complete